MLSQDLIAHMKAVLKPALALAPRTFMTRYTRWTFSSRHSGGSANHDTGPIYNWLISLSQLQGISDQIAWSYAERHGLIRWLDVEARPYPAPSLQPAQKLLGFHAMRLFKISADLLPAKSFSEMPVA